jgi:hypothetical protein
MSKRPSLTTLCVTFLLLSILACSLQPAATPVVLSGQFDIGATTTALASTIQAFNQPSSSPGTPSLASDTLTPSLTPTLSPTFFLTPLPLQVSVSLETNCRTGPGAVFPVVGVLHPGETAEVVGISAYKDNWVIQNPDGAGTCWLWGQYATVSGDINGVPTVQPPPTPTPVMDFSFAYRFWGVGPGYECMLFDVTDSGATIWQSYSLSLVRISTSENGASSSNDFVNYDNWCTVTATLHELAPGDTGTAMVIMHLVGSPAGDTFRATLTLCSQDGLAGACLTKTIEFVF